MANGASDLVKALLASHVGTSGWGIEIGMMPNKPDRVMSIVDTAGIGEDPNPKWLLDYPTCQIMVRGETSEYVATRNEAYAVKNVLLGIDSQDVLGDRLVAINMNGDIGFVGRDDDMRLLFALNLALIVEPQSTPETNRLAL